MSNGFNFLCDVFIHRPEDDEEAMFQWMKTNFDRHYKGNRAPFGVFIHAAWFLIRDSHWPAYKRLVAHMNSLPDVYLVSVAQSVDYTRNPRAVWEEAEVVEAPEEDDALLDTRNTKRHTQILEQCQRVREPTCHANFCQLRKEKTNEERWMSSCATCPEVYPWLGNPLGLAARE